MLDHDTMYQQKLIVTVLSQRCKKIFTDNNLSTMRNSPFTKFGSRLLQLTLSQNIVRVFSVVWILLLYLVNFQIPPFPLFLEFFYERTSTVLFHFRTKLSM